METVYGRSEIVSSSMAARKLGEILNLAKQRGRVVLSRNNKLEAVLLPIEGYEDLVEDLEHLLIALEIQDRLAKARGKTISWETIKAKHGL